MTLTVMITVCEHWIQQAQQEITLVVQTSDIPSLSGRKNCLFWYVLQILDSLVAMPCSCRWWQMQQARSAVTSTETNRKIRQCGQRQWPHCRIFQWFSSSPAITHAKCRKKRKHSGMTAADQQRPINSCQCITILFFILFKLPSHTLIS
jgi:hypothetical protein